MFAVFIKFKSWLWRWRWYIQDNFLQKYFSCFFHSPVWTFCFNCNTCNRKNATKRSIFSQRINKTDLKPVLGPLEQVHYFRSWGWVPCSTSCTDRQINNQTRLGSPPAMVETHFWVYFGNIMWDLGSRLGAIYIFTGYQKKKLRRVLGGILPTCLNCFSLKKNCP